MIRPLGVSAAVCLAAIVFPGHGKADFGGGSTPSKELSLEDKQAVHLLAAPPATGLLILRLLPERAAEQAGVQPGDILTHYGEAPVATLQELQRQVRRAAARGDGEETATRKVKLRLLRKGRQESRLVRMGPLGVETAPLRKGFPVRRHPRTAFTPNLKALRSGETWFELRSGGAKRGFERLALNVSPEGELLRLDHASRARLDGPAGSQDLDLRFRLDLTAQPRPTLRSLSISDAGRSLLNLDRVAFMLTGTVSGEKDATSVTLTVPERVLPMQALPLLALTMPRTVGATDHLSLLDEAELFIRNQYELRCAARETLPAAPGTHQKPQTAFRYDATRYGVTTHRYWITSDHRVVKAEYVGSLHLFAAPPEAAVEQLPAGLDPVLPAAFSPLPGPSAEPRH